MKKILPVLLAALLIVVICAACGPKNDNPTSPQLSSTMAPVPTAEPTAEPTPTAPPAPDESPADSAQPDATEAPADATEAPAQEGGDSGNNDNSGNSGNSGNNNNGNSGNGGNSGGQSQPQATPEPEPEPTPAPDPYAVANSLTGQDVSALYNAIGYPNSSSYSASCLVLDGEDGLLYYSGFTVATARYSDGSEVILGAFN